VRKLMVVGVVFFIATAACADSSVKDDLAGVGKGLGQTGKKTGQAFKQGGQTVGRESGKVGRQAGQDAGRFGREAGKTGKEVGREAGAAGRKTGEFFKGMALVSGNFSPAGRPVADRHRRIYAV
jgi:hypothetical protein